MRLLLHAVMRSLAGNPIPRPQPAPDPKTLNPNKGIPAKTISQATLHHNVPLNGELALPMGSGKLKSEPWFRAWLTIGGTGFAIRIATTVWGSRFRV